MVVGEQIEKSFSFKFPSNPDSPNTPMKAIINALACVLDSSSPYLQSCSSPYQLKVQQLYKLVRLKILDFDNSIKVLKIWKKKKKSFCFHKLSPYSCKHFTFNTSLSFFIIVSIKSPTNTEDSSNEHFFILLFSEFW